MQLINFNGQIQSENVPVIHSWNRAFRFGDGLFESIAVAKGAIPFLDDHWNRLTSGVKFLSLELAPGFDKNALEKSVLELLPLNSIEGNAYARVMIFREGKGRYSPDEMQAGYVIEVEPVQGNLFQLNDKGLSLGLFTEAMKSIDGLANYKTCSSLVYVLASIYKSKEGLDDCVIFNSRSNICESTNSNVFLVKDNIILTPSLEEGCINGVMRKQIIAIAKNNGFAVNETVIENEMLGHADEVFLTNAVSGIRWVGNCGNRQYANKVSSSLSDYLRASIS